MGIVLTSHNNRIILNREVAEKLTDTAKEINARLYTRMCILKRSTNIPKKYI
jgi:hypothetical protein